MKNLIKGGLIAAGLIMSSLTANAGTADLVTCISDGGTKVTVTDVSTPTAVFTNIRVEDGRGATNYQNRKTAGALDPNAFTVTGLSALLSAPGVIGKGIMLAVEGQKGVLARNGLIEKLNCQLSM